GTGLAIPLALAAMAIGGGIIVEGLVITNEHNQPQIGLVYMISGLAIIIAAALAISGINMAKKLANKAIQAAKKQIESTLEVTSKLVSVIPGLDSFNTALRAVAQKLSFSGTVGSLKIAAILLSILAAGYAAFNKAGSAADTSVKTSIEAAQNGTAGGSDSEVTTTGRVPLGSIE
ncbi:MAG: hypothetical protein NTW04_02475, partial [Elusimicrobia bacterium]|nr:hypothetical protein [Elusimicrobiota bacterium]